MEMLRMIYPYTLYILYGLSACAFLLLIVLLVRILGTLKSLKLTLAPVSSIQSRIQTIQTTSDSLSKDIRKKNSEFQQFIKKTGLFFAVWHIIFPKKDKRRR